MQDTGSGLIWIISLNKTMSYNVCTNHAVVFAAIKQPILSRQKQWNDHNIPYQKSERCCYICYVQLPVDLVSEKRAANYTRVRVRTVRVSSSRVL